jgi:fucose permease
MTSQNAGTWTILIAFLAFAGLGLQNGLLGVAWPFMQKEFNLALDAVNVLLLVQTITYALASFFVGRTMARFGSGMSLVGGMVIMMLCLFGIALSVVV